MSTKTTKLAPPATHWFTPVKPVVLTKKPLPTLTSRTITPAAPTTTYTGKLSG